MQILLIIGIVFVLTLIALYFTSKRKDTTMTQLTELCAPLKLTQVQAKYAPAAYAGIHQGARIAIVTGLRDASTIHVLTPTLAVYMETGKTKKPSSLPEGITIHEGKLIFKGSGLDIVIRSIWPEGWKSLYLRGAIGKGIVTQEKLMKTIALLHKTRKEIKHSHSKLDVELSTLKNSIKKFK